MSTMFLGSALTPILGSTWHGIPQSKHSKTNGDGVAELLDKTALLLFLPPVPVVLRLAEFIADAPPAAAAPRLV